MQNLFNCGIIHHCHMNIEWEHLFVSRTFANLFLEIDFMIWIFTDFQHCNILQIIPDFSDRISQKCIGKVEKLSK